MDGVGQAIFNWMSGYPETDHAPDRCGQNAFSERHLVPKMISSPRRARDKRRKS